MSEKEVQLLENMLKARGIERKRVGTNEHEDVNAFKEKQRELEALALVEKEVQAKSAELDQRMERIQQIDARKFVKDGLGKLLKLTDERVELALPDYDKLVKMGRQNVKLRNENRILSSQVQEVAQKEWEADRRLANVNERERTLNTKHARRKTGSGAKIFKQL